MKRSLRLRLLFGSILLLLGTRSFSQSEERLLVIEGDTIVCFSKTRAAEIANFSNLCRRDSLRLVKALEREKSLELIIESKEADRVVSDSLIAVLERQILLGDDEVNRLIEDCRTEKRNHLIVGGLGGFALGVLAIVLISR